MHRGASTHRQLTLKGDELGYPAAQFRLPVIQLLLLLQISIHQLALRICMICGRLPYKHMQQMFSFICSGCLSTIFQVTQLSSIHKRSGMLFCEVQCDHCMLQLQQCIRSKGPSVHSLLSLPIFKRQLIERGAALMVARSKQTSE